VFQAGNKRSRDQGPRDGTSTKLKPLPCHDIDWQPMFRKFAMCLVRYTLV
jgi:hypothetical protein